MTSLSFCPHAYQDQMLQTMLKGSHGPLMDMGLGKTVVTLVAISKLLDSAEITGALIVAPLRVASITWPDEIKKWQCTRHLKVSKILGSERERTAALSDRGAHVYLTNYENFKWLVQKIGKDGKPPFDTIVFDESTKMKNPSSKRFKIAKLFLHRVPRRYILTGTPTPNGLMDLWSQIYLLDQGQRLGKNITAYRNRWFYNPDRRGWEWVARDGAEQEITEAIADIVTVLKAEDYLTMPDLIENTVYVDIPDRKQYKELEDEMFLTIDKREIEAVSAAVLSMKCRQYAAGCLYDTEKNTVQIHDEKFDALDEIIEQASGPVLIAYDFVFQQAKLKSRYPKIAIPTSKDAHLWVDKWNRGSVPLMAVHPASMAHGLNLQDGGCTIVFLDMPWSLELYDQLIGRLHRQGQAKPVIVHHIVARGTVDQVVKTALHNKAKTQAEIKSLLLDYRAGMF